jgi:hypothetical protein
VVHDRDQVRNQLRTLKKGLHILVLLGEAHGVGKETRWDSRGICVQLYY